MESQLIIPTAKQKKGTDIILSNKYSDILFTGAARAGKTFDIVNNLIWYTFRYPDIRILMARERLNHAISALWLQTIMPLIDKYYPGVFDENKSQHILTNKITNAQIWLGGLDTKERAEKIFGQEYAIIFLNEAVQLSQKTVAKIQTRLAQKIDGLKNFMIYDCNPRSPSHWIYKLFYIEKPEGYIRLDWHTKDNIEHISDTTIKRLERLPETERRRYLLGEWCDVEGAVYDNIYESHVDEYTKDWGKYDDIILGADWGYYTAVNIWGIKRGKVDQAYCIYEIYIINGKTSDVIDALDKIGWIKENSYKIYCDHENDRIQELCDAGYVAVPAYKEVGAGDSSVNEFELYFDIECAETFQSMLNLMHQQDKDGNYIDAHEKVNDHPADGGRYALHGWRKDNSGGQAHVFIKNKGRW